MMMMMIMMTKLSIHEKTCCEVSCSSTACDWTTGTKRSHCDSIQLTDKQAVSHSSGDVIVESAFISRKARSS